METGGGWRDYTPDEATDWDPVPTKVGGALDQLAARKAGLASTDAGEGAALVGIEDVDGNFTATDVEGALAEVGAVPRIAYHEATILFSDLGSGATDSIAIANFPTDVILLGVVAKADPQFTGGADLVFEIGFEGGDTNALVESTALHETGVGTPISVVHGVVKGGAFYADASTAGLAVLFTATELDDVTAGELTVRFYYLPAF